MATPIFELTLDLFKRRFPNEKYEMNLAIADPGSANKLYYFGQWMIRLERDKNAIKAISDNETWRDLQIAMRKRGFKWIKRIDGLEYIDFNR